MCGFAKGDGSDTALHCVKNSKATANLSEKSELKRVIGDIRHV